MRKNGSRDVLRPHFKRLRSGFGAQSCVLGMAYDEKTKATLQKIPLLTVRAGPRDADWLERLKEELMALIQYVEMNQVRFQPYIIIVILLSYYVDSICANTCMM